MRARRIVPAVLALTLMAALAVGLTACGCSGGSSSSPSSSKPGSGGTLKVTFQDEPASLDPAVAADAESWSIERLTYQTLLTYASKPGAAGTRLVPDLATEVPDIANGGITDKGAADIVNVPQHIDQSVNAWQEVGGQSLNILLTMGEYDYCCIGEAQSDDVVMTFLFKLAKRTMCAPRP
jgi:ABC-type transport system substrate-binding protein